MVKVMRGSPRRRCVDRDEVRIGARIDGGRQRIRAGKERGGVGVVSPAQHHRRKGRG